jgi:hypothetical protein
MAETFFQEGDVQALINNAGGVSVTVGAVTANGLRDVTDEEAFVGQVGLAIGRQVSVIVKTGTFPALAAGVSITVEGTAYKVVEVRRIEDGALTRVLCAEP